MAASPPIASRWIWDGTGRPPFAGTVTVVDGTIVAVTPVEGSEVGSLPPTLLTVGLANAHLHLDLTTERPGDRLEGPFTDWLLGVVTHRSALGEEGLSAASARGIEASIAAGVTLLVDDDWRGRSNAALADSPIRRAVLREVIAPDRARLETEGVVPFLAVPDVAGREVRGLFPHAPYTVTPSILEELLARCDEERRPWAMHVAESPWERELLERGTGEGAAFLRGFGADPAHYVLGRSMVTHLAATGRLGPRAMLVHGNHLDDTEIELLAERGGTVVYCPRSHAYFGHPEHPYPRLLAAGVPVAFGTDGAISAGDLDLLEEMRRAMRAHPEVSAEEIWRSATIPARRAVDKAFGRGTIERGEPADLVRWTLPERAEDEDTPLEFLLTAVEKPEREVWIAGEKVVGEER